MEIAGGRRRHAAEANLNKRRAPHNFAGRAAADAHRGKPDPTGGWDGDRASAGCPLSPVPYSVIIRRAVTNSRRSSRS
jgi:hypothetical protein